MLSISIISNANEMQFIGLEFSTKWWFSCLAYLAGIWIDGALSLLLWYRISIRRIHGIRLRWLLIRRWRLILNTDYRIESVEFNNMKKRKSFIEIDKCKECVLSTCDIQIVMLKCIPLHKVILDIQIVNRDSQSIQCSALIYLNGAVSCSLQIIIASEWISIKVLR